MLIEEDKTTGPVLFRLASLSEATTCDSQLKVAMNICVGVKLRYPKLSFADLFHLAGELAAGPVTNFAPGQNDEEFLSKLSALGYNALEELAKMKTEKNKIERERKSKQKKDLAAIKKEVDERHRREARREAEEVNEKKRKEEEEAEKKINEDKKAVADALQRRVQELKLKQSESTANAMKLKSLIHTRNKINLGVRTSKKTVVDLQNRLKGCTKPCEENFRIEQARIAGLEKEAEAAAAAVVGFKRTKSKEKQQEAESSQGPKLSKAGKKLMELPSVDSGPKPYILVDRSESANKLTFPSSSAAGETTSPAIIPSNIEATTSGGSTQLPLSPRLSSELSGYHTPEEAMEQELPTHTVTPPKILMGVSSAEASITDEEKRSRDTNIQDDTNDAGGIEVDQSVQAREESGFDSRSSSPKLPESVPCTSSDVANLGDAYNEQSQSSNHPVTDSLPQFLAMQETLCQVLLLKISGMYSCRNVTDTVAFYDKPSCDILFKGVSKLGTLFPFQIMVLQKEMQKQLLNSLNGPIIEEGKRLEVALGRMIEKSNKANADALRACFQEETVKNEKALRDHSQQIVNATENYMSKELNAMFEKKVLKEFDRVVPALARAATPVIEKAVFDAITESFKRGIGDKAVNQLDRSVKSKLEATISGQIQTQFQTSSRQALQEAVRSTLESSVIPSFERSCKTMFDQMDSAFKTGLAQHTNAVQQRVEFGHSQLAHTLRDTIINASSVAQALSRELAESQRNLLALAAAGANSGGSNPLATQLSGSLGARLEKVEAPIDLTTEISRLISKRKYDKSFVFALRRSDVSIVSWLCSQVDLRGLLTMNPLPLSQGVLLPLLQQLAWDISNDTSRKLAWMTDVVIAINPYDQTVAVHGRPVFEQVYQILNHHCNAPGVDVSVIRLLMHDIKSMLMSCK
ncbi:unnamed protein product [Cochlearia groenlandica]